MWEWVRQAVRRAWDGTAEFFKPVATGYRRLRNRLIEPRFKLSYFDEALAVELDAVNKRREKIATKEQRVFRPVRKLDPVEPQWLGHNRPPSPPLPQPAARPAMTVNAKHPDAKRMRPLPIPCTAIGIALSGGGIRSAAFCLGALQALDFYGVTTRTDYLSTVSGGGYVGTCLTASMSRNGGEFPFGGAADVHDNEAIGHIRNYSNYLMPRAQSALRNVLDVASILLRGLLANALIVLTFLLAAACVTFFTFPTWPDLRHANFVLKLVGSTLASLAALFKFLATTALPSWLLHAFSSIGSAVGSWALWLARSVADFPFALTIALAAATAVILIFWAWKRSTTIGDANDVNSRILVIAASSSA